MILLSSEMFEKVVARAQGIGEEMFRRIVFDHNGMNPKAIEVAHDQVVAAIAKLYVKHLAQRANETLDRTAMRERTRAAGPTR
jgi:hypothetical protein